MGLSAVSGGRSISYSPSHDWLLIYQLQPATINRLTAPRVLRSTFGSPAFASLLPVWNSFHAYLRNPAFGHDQFRRDLKTLLSVRLSVS